MFNYLQELAKEYNMSIENVLSIALNRYGLIIPNYPDNRIRFNLKMQGDHNTYFAVCVNTYLESPFTLKDNMIYLDKTPIGLVSTIEKDTCTSTYFRNNKQAITFNSNSRSKCIGCKFCGTYSLDDLDSINFSTKENIKNYFGQLLKENNISSMKQIKDVTICTGCFKTEDDLINHLLLVNESFKDLDFNGRINYIGSQLRDYDKIKLLKKEIDKFSLFLTLEKFIEREKFMRKEKASLTISKAKDLLDYTKSHGITSTFLYILGLENLDVVSKYFNYLKDSVNKFPIIQVFQDYTIEQEEYRHDDAKDIRYYLEARKIINEIFKNTNLNPEYWECFRSLYFDDKKTTGFVKCKTK